jgi:hypothetical protein
MSEQDIDLDEALGAIGAQRHKDPMPGVKFYSFPFAIAPSVPTPPVSGARSFGEALAKGVPIVLANKKHVKGSKTVDLPIQVISPSGKDGEVLDLMEKMGIITRVVPEKGTVRKTK